jgi:stage V sporulation protein G
MKGVVMPQVSEVQITFIKPQNGLIGFASFVLDNGLYLSGVGIHSKMDGSGYRLTYPTRPLATRKAGQQQASIFHPINRMTGKEIERAVFAKLNDVMEKCNVGHSGFNDGLHPVSD